jgi:nucleoside-diphosphate-sugar epimerase
LAVPLDNTSFLVTGGSGFLGQYCLRHLAKQFPVVHAVSRNRDGKAADGVIWHRADLRVFGAAEALIARLRPSHLLHLAWVATPDTYRNSPENIDWLEASLALIRAFGQHGGRRFVGIGSSAEYGLTDSPCIEDVTPIRPVTIYGKCKAALFSASDAYAKRFGFSAAWGRVFLLFGPGDPPQRLFPSLVAALSARRPIMVTDGRQIRDLIYAADAADLLLRLLANADAEGAYNVATGRGIAVRDAIEWVADELDARQLLQVGAMPRRTDEPLSLVADMSKVARVLDWRAPTSLKSGLQEVLASLGHGNASPMREGGRDSCVS